MTPPEGPSHNFLKLAVKVAWFLVVVEGAALLVALYFIWAALPDIIGSFHFR